MEMCMSKALEIALLVVLPLLFGLLADFVFERIRRRHARRSGPAASEPPHDWVI